MKPPRRGKDREPALRPAILAVALALSLVILVLLDLSLAPLILLSTLTIAPLVYLVYKLRPLKALAYSFIASSFVGSLTYSNIVLVEEFLGEEGTIAMCQIGGSTLLVEALVIPLGIVMAGLPAFILSSCYWTVLLEGLASGNNQALFYGLSSWLYFSILTVYLVLILRTMPLLGILAQGKFLVLTILLPLSLAARIIFISM
ncbi:MAG: hypothetical protein F7C07_06605 [Desulfurococcales archaeon]|nr:hypothetical protein [Desulfurococcales archaeon]